MVQFVTSVTDWEAEALVSYKPWTEADIDAKGIKDAAVAGTTTEAQTATTEPMSNPATKVPEAPTTAAKTTTAPVSTTAPASKESIVPAPSQNATAKTTPKAESSTSDSTGTIDGNKAANITSPDDALDDSHNETAANMTTTNGGRQRRWR